jgi:hypothetical protein
MAWATGYQEIWNMNARIRKEYQLLSLFFQLIEAKMSNAYSNAHETEGEGLDSTKNQELGQMPLSAVQRRRAALEELDEAKFSVRPQNQAFLVSISISLNRFTDR